MRPLNEFIMTLMAAISLYISVDLWRQTPTPVSANPSTTKQESSANTKEKDKSEKAQDAQVYSVNPETEEPPPRESGCESGCYVPHWALLAGAYLTLHREPDRRAQLIKYVPDITVLHASGRRSVASDGTEWLEVSFSGWKGWVDAHYTRKY